MVDRIFMTAQPRKHRQPRPSSASRRQKQSVFLVNIKRIAASDRISGMIMLAAALIGFICANLTFTYPVFESVRETVISIPFLHLHLTVDQWAQDGLLTIF